MAGIDQRNQEIERLTRAIHSVLIESYSKGKSGEEILRQNMAELSKMGLVKAKQPIRDGIADYAIVFRDGKVLAVDSKLFSIQDLSALSGENLSPEDRARVQNDVRRKVRDNTQAVQKYIDTPHTLPQAVMAVPDSVMEMVNEVIPKATAKNIMVVYSAEAQLVPYFVRIHESYAIAEDVADLQEKISKAQQEIFTLDEKFFQNNFEKPLGTLGKAARIVQKVVSEITGTLAFKAGKRSQEKLEPPATEEEHEISVSTRA